MPNSGGVVGSDPGGKASLAKRFLRSRAWRTVRPWVRKAPMAGSLLNVEQWAIRHRCLQLGKQLGKCLHFPKEKTN